MAPAASLKSGAPGFPKPHSSKSHAANACRTMSAASPTQSILSGTFKSSCRAAAARCSGSATARKLGASLFSCVLSHAFNVSSGPIPAGSPWDRASGSPFRGRGLAITITPSVFHNNGLGAQLFEPAFTVRCDMVGKDFLRDGSPCRAIVLGCAFFTYCDHFETFACSLRSGEMPCRSGIKHLAQPFADFDCRFDDLLPDCHVGHCLRCRYAALAARKLLAQLLGFMRALGQ